MGINNKKRRVEKKRRKLKKKKIYKKELKNPLCSQFVQLENPLSNLSGEDRKKFIMIHQEDSKSSYSKSLEKILSIFSNYDPLILISMLSQYGLMVPVGDEGIDREKIEYEEKLQQADVEMAQALLLTIKEFKDRKLPTPHIFQELQDALVNLRKSFYFLRLRPDHLDKNMKDLSIMQIQEEIRSHTHTVRNWGHYSQVKRISTEIYQVFDEKLIENVFEFGDLEVGDLKFTEDTPYNPSSPYSASKASGDMLINSYHRTYKFNSYLWSYIYCYSGTH